jgi:hypothetical protein
MPIPNPEPGLVISYGYLWHSERQAGQEEGRKNRPSVIVLAVEREADGATVVTVLPITHSAPADPAATVEIPSAVKRHLGLDDDARGSSSPKATSFSGPATTCASFRTATATTTASCPLGSSIRCLGLLSLTTRQARAASLHVSDVHCLPVSVNDEFAVTKSRVRLKLRHPDVG